MKVLVQAGISRRAGGLFYAVSSLCKALHSDEVEIIAAGDGAGFNAEEYSVWDPVPVEPYKAVGPMGSSVGLRRILTRSGTDMVHQHGIWNDDQWAALNWQKKCGKPVVISPHGMLDPWAIQNSAWKKKIVGKLFANESLQKATCIHALCQSELESIRAYGLKNPVALIPNGIEMPEIGDQKTEDRGRKTFLFLGRIHPKKGLSELIQAWAKARNQKPTAIADWQLIIAGWDDGGHESGLRDLSKELGVDASVDFIGPKFGTEKETLLRAADAFILPSFSEGLPMSVLEAWSYGLPVVMTDFCNLPEGFESEAAVRIEPNVESIASGLDRLCAMSVDARNAMASNGRELVEQKFTWPKIADDMYHVYSWCIHGGTPPSCMVFD